MTSVGRAADTRPSRKLGEAGPRCITADAVVRLHMACRTGVQPLDQDQPPDHDLGSGRGGDLGLHGSVRQARTALNQLLRAVGSAATGPMELTLAPAMLAQDCRDVSCPGHDGRPLHAPR